MSTDPTDWHQVLARVTGVLVRGEQRVSTQELFAKFGLLPLSVRRVAGTFRRLERDSFFDARDGGLSINGVGSRSPTEQLYNQMQVARTCAGTPLTPGAAPEELS
jgi:hypothetical protein